MLFISSRLHGMFDYLLALILILSPWMLDLSEALAPALVSVGIGVLLFTLALVTDYELGAVHILPLSTHISIDVAIGITLLMSPWMIGFDDLPHHLYLIAGASLLAVAAFTVRLPKNGRVATQYVQWV